MPIGQERQLELYLVHFAHYILTGQPQVNAGGVDVPVPELLLKGVEAPTAVEEVDGVAVTEQVSVDTTAKTSSSGRLLDNLIGPLLRDVTSLARNPP